MSLSKRDRTMVNAALVTIHDAGHDPQAVINMARQHIAQGKPAVAAYKLALNAQAQATPKIEAALSHVIRLVQSSDDRTVARYDKALSSYIETGDPDVFHGISDTFLTDSVTLAQRSGQTADDLARTLGFDDPTTLQEAAARVPAAATFAFAPAGEAAPADTGNGDMGHTGYVSAKANAKQRHDEQMAGPAMRMAFPGHADSVPMSREAAKAMAAAPRIEIIPSGS